MDRYTIKQNPKGWPENWPDMFEPVACQKNVPEWCENWKDQHECKCDAIAECINQLGRYENTGLTPDEIAALCDKYDELLAVYNDQVAAHGRLSEVNAALRAEVEPLRKAYASPEKPLMLAEIERMEGEPVFVQQGDGQEFWAIVQGGMPDTGETDPDFVNMEYDDPVGHFGLHVLGWRAFKHRPEVACAALRKEAD